MHISRAIFPGFIFLTLAFTSEAQTAKRYETTRMTCDQVQEILTESGTVILRYPSRSNSSLIRYDRYVAHDGFCAGGEFAKQTVVPTADTRQCGVFRCSQKSFHSK